MQCSRKQLVQSDLDAVENAGGAGLFDKTGAYRQQSLFKRLIETLADELLPV